MKLYDIVDGFDKYEDVQIFCPKSETYVLHEDNLLPIDRSQWINHLASDVICTVPMKENEYNRTVLSSENEYLDFGDYYDYTDARVLVVLIAPSARF